MWDEHKIVHGKPRHSQSQRSVERANQDIEKMWATWLGTNKTTHWSEGLRFIKFMKNKTLHLVDIHSQQIESTSNIYPVHAHSVHFEPEF